MKEEDYKIQEDVIIPYSDKRTFNPEAESWRAMTPEWKESYECGDLYRVYGAERTGTYGRFLLKFTKKVSWIIKQDIQKVMDSTGFHELIRKHLISRI